MNIQNLLYRNSPADGTKAYSERTEYSAKENENPNTVFLNKR